MKWTKIAAKLIRKFFGFTRSWDTWVGTGMVGSISDYDTSSLYVLYATFETIQDKWLTNKKNPAAITGPADADNNPHVRSRPF
jgi:hypothetical protein